MEKKHTVGVFLRRHWKEIICFLGPIALMLAYNLLAYGFFADISPDARLYMSIADNFLSTGHFHETARGGEYVVPFGFPLILTVFRLFRLDVNGIAAIQYLMLGGACLLLYKTEENLFGRGGIAPVVYVLMLVRIHLLTGYLYVEHYYLFLLAWMLWLLSNREMSPVKRILWLNAAGFGAFTIRTVLVAVYVPILIYTVFLWGKKRLPGRWMVLSLLIPGLLMGINTAVNHRETGHWIVTDNYSGADLYAANNPNTKTVHYNSSLLPDFVDGEYDAVQADTSLDFTEKNALLGDMAKQWARENPGAFLKNTAVKFISLFITYWKFLLIPAFLGAAAWIVQKRDRLLLAVTAVGLLLAVVTSAGLIMGRYAAPVIPLAGLQYSAGLCFVRSLLNKKKPVQS